MDSSVMISCLQLSLVNWKIDGALSGGKWYTSSRKCWSEFQGKLVFTNVKIRWSCTVPPSGQKQYPKAIQTLKSQKIYSSALVWNLEYLSLIAFQEKRNLNSAWQGDRHNPSIWQKQRHNFSILIFKSYYWFYIAANSVSWEFLFILGITE